MITKCIDNRPSMFLELQPGDGTRYEFVVFELSREWLYVSGSLMSGYYMEKTAVMDAVPYVLVSGHEFRQSLYDGTVFHYVNYLAEHNGFNMPYGPKAHTARAAIMAADHALRVWEKHADIELKQILEVEKLVGETGD